MIDNYYVGMIIVVVISYLLGSIPTAYLVARWNGLNIFDIGSGNMGATNVVRALGAKWGAFVMFFDMFKGAVAIIVARVLMPESPAAATSVAAVSAIVGHNWSLFASLITGTIKGGKGAATAFGTLIMIAPVQVLVAMMVLGMIIVARTRYVSLAVLTAFAVGLIWLNVLVAQQFLTIEVHHYTIILAALLVFRFRANIQRLLAGKERRLGERAKS